MARKSVPAMDHLVDCFASLPGVGRKSAARLAHHLLSIPAEEAKGFANAILEACNVVHRCPVCHNLTDQTTCAVCQDTARDRSLICVVESPRDVGVFERTGEYAGLYHVLHGLISPMDNVGPDHLYIKDLVQRAASDEVKEVIMATNPTVEGESTAIYISKLIKPLRVKVTRIAYGMPVGGNLEHADEVTIFRALSGRSEL